MAAKPKRAALYLRVSTDGQTVENQRLALRAYVSNAVGRWCRSMLTLGSSPVPHHECA